MESSSISHQLFYFKITFVNSQHEETSSKDCLNKKTGLNILFKNFRYTKINMNPIWHGEFNLHAFMGKRCVVVSDMMICTLY